MGRACVLAIACRLRAVLAAAGLGDQSLYSAARVLPECMPKI